MPTQQELLSTINIEGFLTNLKMENFTEFTIVGMPTELGKSLDKLLEYCNSIGLDVTSLEDFTPFNIYYYTAKDQKTYCVVQGYLGFYDIDKILEVIRVTLDSIDLYYNHCYKKPVISQLLDENAMSISDYLDLIGINRLNVAKLFGVTRQFVCETLCNRNILREKYYNVLKVAYPYTPIDIVYSSQVKYQDHPVRRG